MKRTCLLETQTPIKMSACEFHPTIKKTNYLRMKKIIFAALMFSAGLFACQSGTKSNQTTEAEKQVTEVSLKVEGMTCDHCEMSIQKGVAELPGIESVLANHEDSTTVVKFDQLKTSEDDIKKAIEKRGYHVKGRI